MENNPNNNQASLERNELHNTIWKVANELRGSVDGWDFKQYVLGILFYRYISENMTHYINKEERKRDPGFDYAKLSDEEAERAREHLIEEKGFFIPPSALFCNVLKNARHNEDLDVTLHNQESINKVYDPCCGSGSLLLQFSKVLGDKNISKGYFGQEINLTTYNLCRINMFLHDINYSKFHIALGDTLLDPKHEDDEPFDAIVSNPLYSTKWVGDSNPLLINDERFNKAGVLAPKNAADLAFTMHMLSYLSNQGTAAIVEFPGVLYRGNAEAKIREYLVTENVIDCVIALPDNLFFGTSIATCILVLKKNKKDDTTLFIDASKEFLKEGKKNKLKEHNREKILQTYIERKEVKHFSTLANIEQIKENDYNLSVNRYVEQEDTKEIIDIKALNIEISQIVEKQSALRNRLESIIKELEGGQNA
ncbi:type I restriction-modification system subunit M [Helicobacter pylori]|nr:type I restriction-modification system subunit M [Helicobacter pylori]